MDWQVILTGICGLVTTVISGFVSWLMAKRKYDSEVDNQVISNMKESLDFYKSLSDDNKERLDTVLQQNKEILQQNVQLFEQNTRLENEVRNLKAQVEKLTQRAAKNKPTTVKKPKDATKS